METNPTATPPQYNPPGPGPKKGLGLGAKIGIGCGGLIVLIVIGIIIAGVVMGPKIQKFAADAQANPTRATATLMVSASGGKMELSAEDDANKRYTVKDVKTGTLTTIYWDAKTKGPKVVSGDFSAIPTAPAETEAPAK